MKTFLSALVALTMSVGLPFPADATGSRSIGDKADDRTIADVKAKLWAEQARNWVKVDAGTKDDMAHLQRALLPALVALPIVVGLPILAAAGDRSIGDKVDDAVITTKVKAKLSTDQAKSLVNVDVDTKDGVVHLQGMVPSLEDKADAGRLARDTEGVVDVINDLKVASSPARDSIPAALPSQQKSQ